MLPSPDVFIKLAQRHKLVLKSRESWDRITETLYAWWDRFHKVHQEVQTLGFDDRFIRKWNLILQVALQALQPIVRTSTNSSWKPFNFGAVPDKLREN